MEKTLSFINPRILGAFGIFFLMSFVIWKTGVYVNAITISNSNLILALLIIFPVILMLCMNFVSKYYNRFVSVLYSISVLWFPTLIYLFIGAFVIAILCLVGTYINFGFHTEFLARIFVIATFLALLYGIINATHIRIKKYNITSKAFDESFSGKKIVLISDVHLGVVRGYHFMKRVCRMVQDLKPDMVIIAGDIIDGPVFDYAKGLSPLKNLSAPLGIIYSPGNHEDYNKEPEKFYPVIKSLTTTLIDQRIIVSGIQIIGLKYARESKEATRARLYNAGYNKSIPSIVILHDPTNTSVLQDEEVSLSISGHTHAGQFFPVTLLMKPMYKEFRYGKNVKGNTTSITTSGVGTVLPPLRLGSNSEIVVLTIN